MHPSFDTIAAAIAFMSSHAQEQPELETIAAAVHCSPFHFQRMFTEWAGVSPKKFLQFMTVEYAKQLLADKQHTVFETALETGLSGTGRLHDLFVNIEGMTPGEYRNGGENLQIQYSIRDSRFGKYLIASTGKGVCNLFFFDGDESMVLNDLRAEWPSAIISGGSDKDQDRVAQFFQEHGADAGRLKLHLRGTPFQLKVWNALLRIPEGSLSSYGAMAKALQQPDAARAVGSAIGSNPVGYIIPCHRVINSIGQMGGYRWGTTRKKAILGWEACRLQPVST